MDLLYDDKLSSVSAIKSEISTLKNKLKQFEILEKQQYPTGSGSACILKSLEDIEYMITYPIKDTETMILAGIKHIMIDVPIILSADVSGLSHESDIDDEIDDIEFDYKNFPEWMKIFEEYLPDINNKIEWKLIKKWEPFRHPEWKAEAMQQLTVWYKPFMMNDPYGYGLFNHQEIIFIKKDDL